jgi:hypothetical protein
LDVDAARKALPCVLDLMKEALKWNDEELRKQASLAEAFLIEMSGGMSL